MGTLTFKSIQLQKKAQADLYGNEIITRYFILYVAKNMLVYVHARR